MQWLPRRSRPFIVHQLVLSAPSAPFVPLGQGRVTISARVR